MSLKIRQNQELIADIDLFLTADFASSGKAVFVTGDDYRAAILIARKGDAIDAKLAKQLGLTPDTVIEKTIRQAPLVAPTVSTEDISSRETRPEKPTAKR